MYALSNLLPLRLGPSLARPTRMARNQNPDGLPPTYIEINLEHHDAPADDAAWFDEKTSRIDFDRPTLSAEEKLVFGYLTMEQHGMFADLSLDEQLAIANTLKR